MRLWPWSKNTEAKATSDGHKRFQQCPWENIREVENPMWLTLAFQTLHAEPLHPQKREAKVSQHHLKQRRPRKPNFPCARWIRKGLNWLFPSIVLCQWLNLIGFPGNSAHPWCSCFLCTNRCLLPFDAAGSKFLAQLPWRNTENRKTKSTTEHLYTAEMDQTHAHLIKHSLV